MNRKSLVPALCLLSLFTAVACEQESNPRGEVPATPATPEMGDRAIGTGEDILVAPPPTYYCRCECFNGHECKSYGLGSCTSQCTSACSNRGGVGVIDPYWPQDRATYNADQIPAC
jgi:hypothetical protein